MSILNGRSPDQDFTTNIGTQFVRLVLGVAQHLPGCLHIYEGPAVWRTEVAAHPASLETLRTHAVAVATAAQKGDLPKNRQERLLRQVRALLWLIRAQLGERIIFSEQVRMLLDIQPESVDTAVFAAAHEELAAVLPTGDSLDQRWLDWQTSYTTTVQTVLPQLQQTLAYLGQYGQDMAIVLTDGEAIGYQPNVVALPANLPVRVDRLVHLAAQIAANCGMVTAAAARYESGETECAVWLNYGPLQLLAQGLPVAMLSAVAPHEEIMLQLLPECGWPVLTAAQLTAIHTAEDALRWVDANVAMMLHGEGLRPRALRRYMMAHKLVDMATAEAQLHQLAEPITAAHVFAPLIGGPLIKAWLDQNEQTITALLNDPPVPSTMLFNVRFGD